MSDALKELFRLVDEAGLTMTFDPKRDVTLCAKCGARAPTGTAWKTKVPGTRDQDCRRLCDECAAQ